MDYISGVATMIFELDQIRPTAKNNYKADPHSFIPYEYGYHTKETKLLFQLLKKDVITLEDVNNLKNIPIQFKIVGEEALISGKMRFFNECVVWYDKENKRYFGKKLDKNGIIKGDTAIASTQNNVFRKLMIDPLYKEEPHPEITKDMLREGAKKMRDAVLKFEEENLEDE